ncbi:Aspartic-type endopeptidase ctsD [Penicillium malachiteum]|nr:Aspartic-type endopeptidase ctsD [Penicillium malachiteum]
MHFSKFLAIAALATGVKAFYPWQIKVDLTAVPSTVEALERRFLPWMVKPDNPEEDSNAKPFTLGIRKFPVRRDDSNIVKANTPTLPHSAAVDQDGHDYSYFAAVEVGSQKEQMWLALDTGSPSSWVFGSTCTSSVCTSHHVFDTSKSTSYISNSSAITVGYGSGTIKGNLGQDTMSIAGLNVTFSFGDATSASSAFANYPIDGILGFGRSGTAGWTIPSFMDVVAKNGHLPANIVGFSLSRATDDPKTGEINFGTVDITKFDGNISYTATNSDIWTIPLDDVYVNGTACGFTGKSATIDTGTTYILIPPNDAATLFAQVPGSIKSDSNYIIPCNSTANIELSFSGIKYSISPDDYIGATSTNGCVSTIVGYQSTGSNDWLVGDVFLKNVYSVFDFDNGKIGFGTRNSTSAPGNGTFTIPASTSTSTTTSISISTATTLSSITATDTAALASGTESGSTHSTISPNSGSHMSFILVPSFMAVIAAIFA